MIQLFHTLSFLLLVLTQNYRVAIAASPLAKQHSVRGPTPKYPVHADTTPNCSWWWDNDGSIACEDMPDAWSISREDFLRWNPGVHSDCSGFLPEWSYCVESTDPPATTTDPNPPTTTTGGSNPTNGIQTPQPIQPGMVNNCDVFEFVPKDSDCDTILRKHQITLSQFTAWNPKVGDQCQSLWAEVYVCVSVIGHTPSSPVTATTTTTETKPTNGIETPQPIQPGMVDNCDKFHKVKKGEMCDDITTSSGISFAEFLKWNPKIGKGCESLWADVYVCISVVGHSTATVKPNPTTTTAGNGVKTPTPTQVGMVKNCNKFHLVKDGQTCDTLSKQYNITLGDFIKWNPAVKKDCTGLWKNTYACVGLMK